MHLYSADRAEPLARRLAGMLVDDPMDPMESEWLAVPTEGMRRWLTLELARYLGASSPGAGDGIAANITRAFPGTLRSAVLDAGNSGEPDPWHIDRMVWSLLSVFEELSGRSEEREFTELAQGAARFSRIRAVADLFDRYHLHRPEMIRAWAEGNPVDGSGNELPQHLSWQMRVWRHLYARIGQASPPERFGSLIDQVRNNELELAIPERLILFGFTSLPGRGFLDLVSAIAIHRSVHLFLLGPSFFDGTALLEKSPTPTAGRHRQRIEDPTEVLVHQPLLRSWGRSSRETALLIADETVNGGAVPEQVSSGTDDGPTPSTLLGRLQDDIRRNAATTPAPVDPEDRSVQFHACFGQMRQAEVARDILLHLLEAEPDLTEEDILIVCPGLEAFAPLVEAAFGSVGGPHASGEADGGGPPRLRFRIADRSISTANPVLAAVIQLLDLVSGRFEVTPVVDFISSAPVRERFAIDDDDLGVIVDWVTQTRVRWGLDVTHRTGFAMPEAVVGNTWQAGLDRLLLGSAAEGDDFVLAVGDIAPSAVDSGDADTLGSLAFVLGQLAEFTQWAESGRHPLSAWMQRLKTTCDSLLAVPEAMTWQFDALRRVIEEILDAAGVVGDASGPDVDLLDVRRLLDGKLANEPGRPDFFRGGITVTSMTPLRWVPFKVVCILGLDQEFVGAPAADAADLVAASPHVGDPDRRIEARQSLLEAVLMARDHLVVIRDGHDVRSSQDVPRVVAAAELFDAVLALALPDERGALRSRLEVEHPRHSFDRNCLVPGALMPVITWTFDPADRARAEARNQVDLGDKLTAPQRIAGAPKEVIDLADLRSFLLDPVAAFATGAMQMAFPREVEADDALLPVEPGALAKSGLGRSLLEARLSGITTEEWLEIERRVGSLPPGALERRVTDELLSEVDALVAEAESIGIRSSQPDYRDIEVVLDAGTRIVGSVPLLLPEKSPGPARIRYVRPKPTFELEAWLDLMALTATDPETRWRSVWLSRGESKKPPVAVDLMTEGGTTNERAAFALQGLNVAVACYRAGMLEPLPIFPSFSKSVAEGDPDWSKWSNFRGWGDARSPATTFFYGGYRGSDLMDIAPVDGDPSGSGGRVKLWAGYLWSAVWATCTEYAP